MKAILLCTLLFLLVIGSPSKPIKDDTLILDTDGTIVYPKTTIEIISAGGGVSVTPRNNTCFDTVFQRKRGGIGISFFPTIESDGGLKTSTDMYVLFPSGCFDNSSECRTYAWKNSVVAQGFGQRTWLVTINGDKDDPYSKFRIEKSGKSYYFRSCNLCKGCRNPCQNIGLINVNGVKTLGLSDVPWMFEFQPPPIVFSFLNPFIGPNCAKFF